MYRIFLLKFLKNEVTFSLYVLILSALHPAVIFVFCKLKEFAEHEIN